MRNLKKILAAITVIAMLASMMVVPALAEGFKYEEEATILNELKLMEGMGLGDSVNRLQGLIFAIKAAGLKDEVDAMTDEEAAAILAEKVVDADEVPAWGVKWTAYAVEKGFTSGVDASVAPKVKFAPLQEVSATSFLVWIMNIGMGYKYGTDVVVAEAVNANVISLSQAMEIGAKAAIIRDDAAGILYGACKNGVNADGKTFIQSLIDAGVVTEEAAIAAGLVEAKPEVLEVVGVSATNLKQLVVEFNMPIKKAGDKDNYSIETEDAQAKIDDKSNFELQDDKKTVLITLTQEAAQQEVIDLKIKGIESESGLKLDETVIKDIELKDTTIPQAISAEVVGKYTIKVKFSEPIDEPPAEGKDVYDFFSVDDGEYLIEKIEKFNNDTELNITLFSALEEGTVTIEAKPAIKDYANFGIYKKAFTLDVVEDETGPVVVDYKDAKPNKVTLVFDEDVELLANPVNNPVNNGSKNFWPDFYHTNENNVADDVKVEGKEVTLTFTTNALPEGRAYIYIKKDALQDLWENKNAKISYVVEVTLDTEPPVIEKIEQDGESAIKVTFSEDLDDDTAENVENYTILKDGKEVEDIISGASLIESKVVKITFNDDLSGDYTLVAQKVEDKAGNAMSKTTVAFTMKDNTAPDVGKFTAKLYNAGDAKKQMIKVSFGEAMAVSGSYSIVDLDKYVINIINESDEIYLGDWKNASIKAVDGNKAVEIKLPCDDQDAINEGKQFDLDDATLTLEIARVADAAGNKMKAFQAAVATIDEAGYVAIDKVELTAEDTVVVTFKDKLTKFKTSDFYRDSNNSSLKNTSDDAAIEIARIRHTVNKDGNSEVALTIAKDYRTTALATGEWKFQPLTVTVTKNGETETFAESANTYGETIDHRNAVNVDDKAAPVVKEVYFVDLDDSSLEDSNPYKGKDMILVVFSEAIDDDTVLRGDNLRGDKKVSGFSVSGNKAELSEAYLLGVGITVKVGTENKPIDPNTAVVLIGKNFNKYTDVSYNDAFGMTDLNSNKVKSFSRKDTLKVADTDDYTPWSGN